MGLSRNAKKAIKILKKLEREVEKFQEVFDEIESTEERNLVGGLVFGAFSTADEIGMVAYIGHTIICDGLIAKLRRVAETVDEEA